MDGSELNAEIDAKEGTVTVEGEHVGHIKGLVFSPDPSIMDSSARPVFTAARRVMVKEVENRVQQLLADNDGAFRLTESGQLLWRENQVAKLIKGESLLFPGVDVIQNDMLQGTDREKIRQRTEKWVRAHLRNRMKVFHELQSAPLQGTARGLAFQLVENFGLINRDEIAGFLTELGKDERKALYEQGVRIGRFAVWMRGLANTQHWPWRVLLWSLWHDQPEVREQLPAQGVKVMHPERDVPLSLYQTLGFAGLNPPSRGDRKDRPIVGQVEALDRLAGHLHSLFRANPDFVQPEGLDKQLGCDEAMVRKLMFAFGYVPSRLSAAEATAAAAESKAKAEAAAAAKATEAASAEAEPAEEAAAEAPAEAAPAEEAPAEAPPAEETPAEETPAETTPEAEAPEAEAPAETTPAEAAPADAPADAPVWTRRGRGAGRPPQRDRRAEGDSGNDAQDKQGAGKGKGGGKGQRPPRKGGKPGGNAGGNRGGKAPKADKPMDPNSPFAVLAQLKK